MQRNGRFALVAIMVAVLATAAGLAVVAFRDRRQAESRPERHVGVRPKDGMFGEHGGELPVAEVFNRHGCGTCHSVDLSDSIGPPLRAIRTTQVELANGEKIQRTEAYLIESVRHHDAKIVAGYPRLDLRFENLGSETLRVLARFMAPQPRGDGRPDAD